MDEIDAIGGKRLSEGINKKNYDKFLNKDLVQTEKFKELSWNY